MDLLELGNELTELDYPDSFTYKSIVKYNMEPEDPNLIPSSTNVPPSTIEIEYFNSRFLFDYEYIDIVRCDTLSLAASEPAKLNMLISLQNYEVRDKEVYGACLYTHVSFSRLVHSLGMGKVKNKLWNVYPKFSEETYLSTQLVVI